MIPGAKPMPIAACVPLPTSGTAGDPQDLRRLRQRHFERPRVVRVLHPREAKALPGPVVVVWSRYYGLTTTIMGAPVAPT